LRASRPEDRDALVEAVAAARPRARVSAGTASPLAVLVRDAGDPQGLPGFAEGRFTVQEQGSQVVALLAGAMPGERVLDACAGRGNKTTFFAAQVAERGSVVALDVSEPKLDRIGPELDRLGLPRTRVETMAVDLTVGTAGLAPDFDRVVVDAPCTGLGTVHRRPEILLRVGEDDPARMAELQRAILARAATLVKPGGTLIYAVCSPTLEEGRAVAATIAGPFAPLETAPVGPWLGDCDVYQVFRWRKPL
jgi:16S rRNA (cytosine967-C5)-methyltransferase